MQTTTEYRRTADAVIKTTTETMTAEVDFNDIIAAAKIEPNDDARPPWEDCDGYEHEDHDSGYIPSASERRGHYYSSGRSGTGVITINPADALNTWGHPAPKGASKQVRAEMMAQEIGRTTDQLVKWYEQGYEAYGVTIDYLDAHSSCWGYDDYSYAESQIKEHAREVAAELKERGHVITNEPDHEAEYQDNQRKAKVWRLKHNLQADCWKEYKTTSRAARKRRGQ